MQDEMNEIVICKHCNKPEYYGNMMWLSGACMCRNCYKSRWEGDNHRPYVWDDLDGKRPTMAEYKKQHIKDSTKLSGGNLW